MPKRHLITALAATAALAACDTLTGLFAGDNSRLAIIERVASSDAASLSAVAAAVPADTGIDAPDTVAVGELFEARVLTWEPNHCWEKDRTEVENGALEAHLWPYNHNPPSDPGVQCPGGLNEIFHTAELRFTEPGEAVLRVTGLRVVDGEIEEATEVTREKTIHVR